MEKKVIKRKVKYINIYIVSREYGGPEEGGWYYDHWEGFRAYEYPADQADRMERHAERLRKVLEEWGNEYRLLIEDELFENETKQPPVYC